MKLSPNDITVLATAVTKLIPICDVLDSYVANQRDDGIRSIWLRRRMNCALVINLLQTIVVTKETYEHKKIEEARNNLRNLAQVFYFYGARGSEGDPDIRALWVTREATVRNVAGRLFSIFGGGD